MATLKTLRLQARALGIPGRSTMNKGELEAAIEQHSDLSFQYTPEPPPAATPSSKGKAHMDASPRGRWRSPQERNRRKATARRRRTRINKRGY